MDYKSLANLGTDLTTFQANQLQGLNQQISVGAGAPEVITLKRDVWETIPKQHFEEMYRLSKLTGVTPSVHAPMIDPTGLVHGIYSESARKSEERLVEDVVEKAHMIGPDRNIIVNIHSDILGKGTVWRKTLYENLMKDKELVDSLSKSLFGEPYNKLSNEQKEVIKKEMQKEITFGVDKETGQLVPIKSEIKYYPEGKQLWTPERSLRNANLTQWMQEVETLHQHEFRLIELEKELKERKYVSGLEGYQKTILTHADSEIAALYDKLQKHSLLEDQNWNKLPDPLKKKLQNERNRYLEMKKRQLETTNKLKEQMKSLSQQYHEAVKKGRTNEAKLALYLMDEAEKKKLSSWSNFFAETVENGLLTPKRIVPLEEFEVDVASKTFAEAAAHSLFDVAKGDVNKAPVISIENPPAQQFTLARADELNKLVEESRRQAVNLFTKRGMSKSQAEKAAEKLIGITWDVGHINMLRQGGYNEKDILKETEKIAKKVKHIHLTDNFGTVDSHLVPGMGNVPIKEMQQIIKKAGFKGTSIIESGGFISQFKASPWPYVLDFMNSPIYEFDAAPSWGPSIYKYETGYAGFVPGYGNILPSQHFAMYGAGFALPPALGALTPGERKKSEFSGTPMS